jgi:hypothetical protein
VSCGIVRDAVKKLADTVLGIDADLVAMTSVSLIALPSNK